MNLLNLHMAYGMLKINTLQKPHLLKLINPMRLPAIGLQLYRGIFKQFRSHFSNYYLLSSVNQQSFESVNLQLFVKKMMEVLFCEKRRGLK